MKVRYTATAARELETAVSYLAGQNPMSAVDFAAAVAATVDRLLEYPQSGQETEVAGVRRAYIRRFRYLIFYAIDFDSDELVVLHIRHAARRWPWE